MFLLVLKGEHRFLSIRGESLVGQKWLGAGEAADAEHQSSDAEADGLSLQLCNYNRNTGVHISSENWWLSLIRRFSCSGCLLIATTEINACWFARGPCNYSLDGLHDCCRSPRHKHYNSRGEYSITRFDTSLAAIRCSRLLTKTLSSAKRNEKRNERRTEQVENTTSRGESEHKNFSISAAQQIPPGSKPRTN